MSQAQFDALIDADERIEYDDWMPDDYRKTLVRQIAPRAQRDHRHAARRGVDHPGAVAPPQGHPHRKGAGRGRPRHVPLRSGRKPRRRPAELLDRLHNKTQKYSSIFNYATPEWADVGAIGWLVDGARSPIRFRSAAAPTGPTGGRWFGSAKRRASISARAFRSCSPSRRERPSKRPWLSGPSIGGGGRAS